MTPARPPAGVLAKTGGAVHVAGEELDEARDPQNGEDVIAQDDVEEGG